MKTAAFLLFVSLFAIPAHAQQEVECRDLPPNSYSGSQRKDHQRKSLPPRWITTASHRSKRKTGIDSAASSNPRPRPGRIRSSSSSPRSSAKRRQNARLRYR